MSGILFTEIKKRSRTCFDLHGSDSQEICRVLDQSHLQNAFLLVLLFSLFLPCLPQVSVVHNLCKSLSYHSSGGNSSAIHHRARGSLLLAYLFPEIVLLPSGEVGKLREFQIVLEYLPWHFSRIKC